MSIYQFPQFQGFSKAEVAQGEANNIYVTIAIVTVIATVGVGLRFASRANWKTKISYENYTIVLALVR